MTMVLAVSMILDVVVVRPHPQRLGVVVVVVHRVLSIVPSARWK